MTDSRVTPQLFGPHGERITVEPCRHCGTPKRIDTWCADEGCSERVQQAQQEERERIFGRRP